KDLNDPTLTKYLVYDDSEYSSVTKTDEISMEVGCQASEVSTLLEAMGNDPMFYRRIKPEEGSLLPGDGKKPGEGAHESGNPPGAKPGAKPAGVGRAKAKAKAKAKFAKVPDNVTDETMKDFISSYKSGISDATGVCAKLTQELEDLETQDKLITMINAASEGMAKTRRDVSNIKLEEDDDAWSKVCAIVERTRPFVVA
ncbi:unnamed protein product, partial [Symbiodinium pilosum]